MSIASKLVSVAVAWKGEMEEEEQEKTLCIHSCIRPMARGGQY